MKRRGKSLLAHTQFELQKLACEICSKQSFQIIFVPNVYECTANSYTMDWIDDSHPYLASESSNHPAFVQELDTYFAEWIRHGYLPNDIECYIQQDGSVAIIDFDKYLFLDGRPNQNAMMHFIPEAIRLKYFKVSFM